MCKKFVDNLLKRYPVVQQFTKFVVIGVINTGVDFLVLNLEMMLTGISKGPYMLVQNAISFSIATINSYFFNKYWTFQDSSKKDAGKKFSQFLAVSVVGVAINSLVVFAITTYIPPMFGISSVLWANLAKLAATGISLIWNFAGYKFWVFKK
jgi:putative flippase GtrA